MAQVNGRNRVRWDDRFDLDVEYVDTVSFGLDLRILMSTIAIVLRADGISQEGEVTADNFGGTLKSELLVFDQRSRTETITTWAVSSTAGHEIGCCEISVLSAESLLLRFDDCSAAAPDIEVRREVVRLLTNRSRATEADFAVCALRADSADRSVLTEVGFQEIADPEEQLKFGHTPEVDSILAVCRLWPDEAVNAAWPRLIPRDHAPAEVRRSIPAVSGFPRADAGR